MIAKYVLFGILFMIAYCAMRPFRGFSQQGAHHGGKLKPARDVSLEVRYQHVGRHQAQRELAWIS